MATLIVGIDLKAPIAKAVGHMATAAGMFTEAVNDNHYAASRRVLPSRLSAKLLSLPVVQRQLFAISGGKGS